jgi:hypothetical protein
MSYKDRQVEPFVYEPAKGIPGLVAIPLSEITEENPFGPQIDPAIFQAGLELSFRAGKDMRELMLDSGMTDAEVDAVIEKAFEWRYKKENDNV